MDRFGLLGDGWESPKEDAPPTTKIDKKTFSLGPMAAAIQEHSFLTNPFRNCEVPALGKRPVAMTPAMRKAAAADQLLFSPVVSFSLTLNSR